MSVDFQSRGSLVLDIFWYGARCARLVSRDVVLRLAFCWRNVLQQCALCVYFDHGLIPLAWGPSAPTGPSPRREFHAAQDNAGRVRYRGPRKRKLPSLSRRA
jgi:hypothetical protein